MPKMREVALEQRVNRLNAVISAQSDIITDLKCENAKLRELVRDIADHVNHGDGFGIDCGWMLDRMRELGIEVE